MNGLEDLVWTLAPLLIPIYALLGGIVVAVVKMWGRQRLAELERRERIVAIERGFLPTAAREPSNFAPRGPEVPTTA